MYLADRLSPRTSERRSPLMAGCLWYCVKYTSFCLLYAHPDSSAATRTRPDSYSPRAFVSSHSRKLANAQTERSVAATSAVLVTESKLGSTYQHCYWMRWESLYRKNDFTTLYRVRRWYLIIQLLSYYLYAACTFMQGYLMTDMAILMLHKNVSRETSDSDGSIPLANQLPSSRRELP